MEKVTCPTCEGTRFSTVNNIYDERGVIEYDMKCPVCDVIVAHWAYGGIFPTFDLGKGEPETPIEFDPDAPFDDEDPLDMSAPNEDNLFLYYCPKCRETLNSSEVNDDRTCMRCGTKTEDEELIWGNPDCKHVKDYNNINGLNCAKCSGWFCY